MSLGKIVDLILGQVRALALYGLRGVRHDIAWYICGYAQMSQNICIFRDEC